MTAFSSSDLPALQLDARLSVRRPGFTLDVPLSAAPGEVVALLGPNGAGKTTALRALAGLAPLAPDGRVTLDGVRVEKMAPERRRIGVVFQDYLLFPHLSALDNVAFGPRCRGVSRRAARELAAEWLARVGLADHARKKPRQLSGGQAQRVALARALAADPLLLLLDEPLAALDARTRLDTRAALRGYLGSFPGATILVTHDPLDALMLADRLVVIEDGAVVQTGDAATITAQPRTDYVARLVGLNLYRGVTSGETVRLGNGFSLVTTSPTASSASGVVPVEVFVAFPPAAVAIHAGRPEGNPDNTWQATISDISRQGGTLRVELGGPIEVAAEVTPAVAVQLGLAPGGEVWITVNATETTAYPV